LATDELVSGGGTGSERWDEHDPLYHREIGEEKIGFRRNWGQSIISFADAPKG
jgi:hypothetical protein